MHKRRQLGLILAKTLLYIHLLIQDLKGRIREGITSFKLRKRAKIRSKLLHKDPTKRKFWRILRNQVKAAGKITAATNNDGKMVFEQPEIEDVVVSHFSDMFKASYTKTHGTDESDEQVKQALDEIDQMTGVKSSVSHDPTKFEKQICAPYTLTELSKILKDLPNGKASGYDSVPNELIKNSGDKFKSYLLLFLNRIMDEGAVPEELNKGKCLLIHKVSKNTQKLSIFHMRCLKDILL